MTDFSHWLKEHWKAGNGTMPDDLAKLAAQQHEALELQPGNDGSNHQGCNPRKCHQKALLAALRTAKEFQEKYSND